MESCPLKYRNVCSVVGAVCLLLFAPSCSYAAGIHSRHKTALASGTRAEPFLGRWDLTIHTPEHNYGSWLELTNADGHLQGRLVGRWGHAHPILDPQIVNGTLTFRSPKKLEGTSQDLVFRGKLAGDRWIGTVTGPKKIDWTWSGKRAPRLDRTAVKGWGKPIHLFNGKNTGGWWFDQPDKASTWSVHDGVLVSKSNGSDIITRKKFKDFKLHIEFNCETDCNSGVYLRGRYEVQIEAYVGAKIPPNRQAGAIYGYITPSPAIRITPGVWESYDITLIGRTVTVAYNGQTIIDRKEIPGPTGGALDSDEGYPGPIYLQGTEKAGGTSFRNIVLTPAVE